MGICGINTQMSCKVNYLIETKSFLAPISISFIQRFSNERKLCSYFKLTAMQNFNPHSFIFLWFIIYHMTNNVWNKNWLHINPPLEFTHMLTYFYCLCVLSAFVIYFLFFVCWRTQYNLCYQLAY